MALFVRIPYCTMPVGRGPPCIESIGLTLLYGAPRSHGWPVRKVGAMIGTHCWSGMVKYYHRLRATRNPTPLYVVLGEYVRWNAERISQGLSYHEPPRNDLVIPLAGPVGLVCANGEYAFQ